MSKKLIYLVSFVFVLGLASSASAELVAYWTFDYDPNDSVGDLNWTLENGASFSYLPFDSKEGSYTLSLDGIDDYGWQDAVGPLIDAFTEKSVALWFRAARTSGLQTLYEEGGATNGLAIRINEGLLEVAVQNAQAIFIASTAFDSIEWTHVAATFDNGLLVLYVNGAEAASVTADFAEVESHSNGSGIGGRNGQDAFDGDGTGDCLGGLIDYVVLYDSVLSAEEVADLAAPPTSWSPIPVDGAMHAATSVNLSWTPGMNAASHNVYLGDHYDSIAGGFEYTLQGSTTIPQFTVSDLTPDTTYYWRVDDVNDQDPNNPKAGDVWSLWIPPQTAYEPSPADGAQFIGPTNVTLSWTAGLGATTHTVYFGDNFVDVITAADGVPQTETTYDPNELVKATTYYWRVDEFDGTDTHTGNVWSFETPPDIPITDPNLVGWWKLDNEGFGSAVDSSGYDHHGTLHGDPQWIDGYDGGALEFDGVDDYVNINGYKGINAIDGVQQPFSVANWFKIAPGASSGNVEMVTWGTSAGRQRLTWRVHGGRLRTEHASGNLRGNTYVDDGEWHHGALVVTEGANLRPDVTKLYVDGVEDTTFSGSDNPYELTANVDVRLGMSGPQNGRYWPGSLDDVRIYDKALTAEEVALIKRIDPLLAWNPDPANGATDVAHNAVLSWTPGDDAAQHDVYGGADAQAVADANASDTTGIYQGRQDLGNESFSPVLVLEQTYYWRVDEVNSDGTISKGRVWRLTVGDNLVVDDFESYTDVAPDEIFATWIDGYGTDTNGALISSIETGIVHGGSQSMPFSYDNNMKYSEATMTLIDPRDWAQQDIGVLSLWYRGYPASVGGFAEDPAGTYTMTASGADIWGQADEFHFAFKQLGFGPCTIIAKVESVDLTNNWAKAGVMVRDTLDAGSKFAAVYITPTNDDGTATNGCRFQGRLEADVDAVSDSSVATAEQTAITAPYWVKLERGFAPLYNGFYSLDGVTWVPMAWNPQIIPTDGDDYVGLALTSHDAALTCEAVLSNVEITGTVGAEWTSQDIGITSNAREPMYVSIANQISPAVAVYNDDPNASTTEAWTEWVIDLQDFAAQGVDLTDVDRISIGFGDKDNVQAGGSGMVYFDDIRLYRPPLVAAFAFGSRLLDCPTFNDPTVNYTMIHHVNNEPGTIQYDPAKGYGYEVVYPEDSPFGSRSGFGIFGPFDNSANNRNEFSDECPEELYDSFIGAKEFTNDCNEATTGDMDTPCATPEGIIFRVDVPNGFYRFVGAFADPDNVHAHRILAEDGGSGPPENIGPNHVVLVSNFDGAQQTIGETDESELGEGVFARVGFDGLIPPLGDGAAPDPQFVDMDENGMATAAGASSPILEVTQGYIRIHQLQGNSNDGPGGSRDPNGGDIVILELWKVHQ